MPLQHINDRTLKRMQRRVRREDIETLLSKLRLSIKNLTMRTTFIVGFPGETDAEFDELTAFVKEAKFERCGVFTYSFEPGTPAVKLDGHLPEEVKQERRSRLMETQQKIALAWSAAQVGKTIEVIVDGPDPEVPGHVQARGHADAPDIDCLVRVKGKNLMAGDIASVKITAADAYDLAARAVGAVR
jgi:ribosomal protein S12 methylthiotransferase